MVVWPDQTVQNDSTFVLLEAERRFPSRPVTPTDPLTAFLALLLEDLFDEWGTKVRAVVKKVHYSVHKFLQNQFLVAQQLNVSSCFCFFFCLSHPPRPN